MNKQDLQAFAREVAKGLKTEQDLNSVIRKAIKKRKLFPSDDSARAGIRCRRRLG